MSTLTRARYAKGQWHEIEAGNVLTQFTQLHGNSRVVFTETTKGVPPSAPYVGSEAINGETSVVGDVLYISDVKAQNNIFFYPLYDDVEFSITTDGSTTAKNHGPAPARQHIYPSNIDETLGRIEGIEADYLYGRVLKTDAADPERTAWSFGDDNISPRADNKTFPTSASNLYVASSNAADTSLEFTCSGLDADGNRVFYTAITDATNGQTPVLFTNALDINFVFISGEGQKNLGEVYFTNDPNFTAGRPDVPSSVLAHVPIGYGCSPQALLKVPEGKIAVCKSVSIGLSRASGAGGSAIIHCNVWTQGGGFTVSEEWHTQSGPPTELTITNLKFSAGTIVYFSAYEVSDNDSNVSVKVLFDYVEL